VSLGAGGRSGVATAHHRFCRGMGSTGPNLRMSGHMVEAWFGILTRKSVRRGSFNTVRALTRHIDAYIADWNTHPTPFVWTKDPAAIVKKVLGHGR
jgi:hypothetical protein